MIIELINITQRSQGAQRKPFVLKLCELCDLCVITFSNI